MKRLSKDMARRLNRLGCKSAELADVTYWLINQGYLLGVHAINIDVWEDNRQQRIVMYLTDIQQLRTEQISLHIGPHISARDYMEAVEMGLQWVLDNRLDVES